MDRAISLARFGDNRTKTNPRVGAVISYKDKIIGEGWHAEFGGPHAEIQALRDVSPPNRHLLPYSTVYVTLEPCSFVGKSPSCAHRLVKENCKRVVIGAVDPNKKVDGRGIQIMQKAGIEVEVGIRKKECERLLLPFYIQQTKKRPFVHLKWAQSYDNFIAKKGERTQISHPDLGIITHEIRGQSQAILVGTDTILTDNPKLDNRYSSGDSLIKVIIDRKGRIPLRNWAFFLSKGPTLGLGPQNHPMRRYFNAFVPVDNTLDISFLLSRLYNFGIGSVMIEDGRSLINSCIEKEVWDRATVIKSPKMIEEGTKAPNLTGKLIKKQCLLNHDIVEIVPKRLADFY
ncbi:MAG: bifunctional diaminohydroxyphosphoribosylaminopyrimidine deaminase/5-amino-6-(5-phosphoribosylamino)uracil reductase RibD [Bacteroidetes bacterium]|jgi:diaminohydroxyphosphoribosylaminopyrimidine deaminase/5-amino-6-(5-phosphoribosylamino)uracil reductase|nr:bifunctional diaminohydroxyphosphoribosylaminopyrimidine deaminase/5-amino-6-(5-phosphoribosylamino)uracil reductase RibD [Bacteroidota bacterium]